jgi:uncharacterized protein YukE
MTASGQFQIGPEAVRSTVGNVGGIIMQTMTALLDLEKMIVAPTSFATIGTAVASANTSMQAQQVLALRSLLNLLQKVADDVKKVADAYQSADQSVATGFGGGSQPTTSTPSTGLWSSPVAAQLAGLAISNSAGATGQPQSAGTVLSYLTQAGLAQSPQGVPTSTPHDFTSWLDASSSNQASLGVIGVYSGAARGFTDVPGGIHNGDLVAITPGSGASDTMIGIIGNSNQLYNNGLLQPQFGDLATLRVYRPV